VIIAAPQVLTPGGLQEGAAVVIEHARIAAVEPRRADVALPAGILAPGFVDLQVNGCFGVDFADTPAAEWRAAARRLPETGVTSFLPTLMTAPIDDLVDGLRRTHAAMGGEGARILGAHVEGPFLAVEKHGAHDARLFCDPTPDCVDALLAPGTLALLTLAPERTGALDAIARVVKAGVVASIGHSDAAAEVVRTAADAGAHMVTHLFNAQRGIHHREPGVAGQALADPRLTCGLIVDGQHISDQVVRIAMAAARGRIALVSDAIGAVGVPLTAYRGRAEVTLRPGEPPRQADGRLAGAILSLDEAVARVVTIGATPTAAIDAATRVPADVLGRSDLGRIAPGAAADLVWLGNDLRVRATWIGGELVYDAVGLAA
jgi:N-acetylglucosamine-6-phosphate deacetylase